MSKTTERLKLIQPEGYEKYDIKVHNDNMEKIDSTFAGIEKTVIKQTAIGETIHATDSAEGNAVEYALFGKARQNTTTGKNLIPYPYYETTREEDGITWTDLGDGRVMANGTATAESVYQITPYYTALTNTLNIKTDYDLILSGCPKGGGQGVYQLQISLSDGSNVWAKGINDYGEGATLKKIDGFSEYNISIIRLVIQSGVKVENLIFEPMLRLASITDDTWEQPTNGATPRPDYPQEIEVSGESGSVVVTSSNEDNTKTKKATIPTPNGLAGIKVSSGGNYTDQSGQQWICDEIVKYADGSGALIQRIEKVVYDGVNNCGTYWGQVEGKHETLIQMNLNNTQALYMTSTEIICDKFKVVNYNAKELTAYTCRQGTNGACCCYLPLSYGLTDKTKGDAWLQENNVTVYYILKEPITTPLTAEQIADIDTFYPVTNISNDFDCGMSVKYTADSKNYIDNQLALQAKAMKETLTAMLLLMPAEVQASMIENDIINILTESGV